MPANNAAQRFYFAGFDFPNFTSVPDQVFDELLPDLSEAELKVLLYICRRTFGFKKKKDSISLTQMVEGIKTRDGNVLDRGTGMTRRGVMKGCAGLVEKGVINVEKKKSEKGDYEVNVYSLRFKEGNAATEENVDERVGNNVPYGREQRSPGVGNNVPLQETVLQQTVKQQPRRGRSINNNSSDSPNPKPDVVVVLTSLGISKKVAQRLAGHYSEQRIREKIDFLHYLQATQPEKVANPCGWLRKAIEDDFGQPDGYKTPEERAQAEAERERQAEEAERQAEVEADKRQKRREQEAQEQEAYIQQLQERYGTTREDLAFWGQVARLLAPDSRSPLFPLVQEVQFLKLEQGSALLGVYSEQEQAQFNHPGLQKVLKRALADVAGRPVEPEIVLLDEPI